MGYEIWNFITHPIVGLGMAIVFAAIAVSGKFSRLVAYWLLVLAWLIGAFAMWYPAGPQLPGRIVGTLLLSSLLFGIGWWIHRPEAGTLLSVKSIQVSHLPRRPGEMLTTTVFLKNLSGRTIGMRYIVLAQTRLIPTTLEAEKQAENDLWSIVTESLDRLGRDAEIPMTGEGDCNMVFESNPFGVEELLDFLNGTHAVYFGAILRDGKTKKYLVEALFFVRNAGIVQFCSQHNRP